MKNFKHIVDPAFLRDSNYSYVNYNDNELSSVLCFAIAKHHNDLILHQQRIELYSNTDKNILLFTALVDLFTTLEDKGSEYKKRMLDKYSQLLSSEQAMILTKSLFSKIIPTQAISGLKESIINKGLQGEALSTTHVSKIWANSIKWV